MKATPVSTLFLGGVLATAFPHGPAISAGVSNPAAAVNAFGIKLYAQLLSEDGNLFFSPFSIACALAMSAEGARGATKTELSDALGIPESSLTEAFSALTQALQAANDTSQGATLRIANGLWTQDGHPILGAYRDSLRTAFGAVVSEVDFRRNHEATREAINTWVADNTGQRIRNLFGPADITAMTRLALANAIYFKADWQHPFMEKATQPASFRVAPDQVMEVSMMESEARYGYAEVDGIQALALPYANKELDMLVVLPPEGVGLDALEARLSVAQIGLWQAALRSVTVKVFLPRFQISERIDLAQRLEALGIRRALNPAEADFSGIDGGAGDLHIGAAVHQAFVEVNEEGTEAAAATGIGISVTSLPPPVPVFRANRPFLFLIRHVPTGATLFLGRLREPQGL